MQHFELLSPFNTIWVQTFTVDSSESEYLNPMSSRPIVDGEWLQFADNYNYTVGRGGDGEADEEDAATVPSFPVYIQSGAYSTQVIGGLPLLFLGAYEARTNLVNSPDGLSVGDPLSVQDFDDGGIVRRGLGLAEAGHYIVGYVVRLWASGRYADWVQFIHEG